MDKGGREDIIAVIVTCIIAIFLLGALGTYFASLSCQNEKGQISDLTSKLNQAEYERGVWRNYSLSLNETINNCTNLIEEQKNICDDRIKNATQDSQNKVESCSNSVPAIKVIFIIYSLSIFLLIPLTFNLFKIIFKVDLGKEVEGFVSHYRRVWFWVKVSLWIALLIVFIWGIFTILSFNPIIP